MIDLAKLSDAALQRIADDWDQEGGNPFGDPRQEIPALVEQVIALRAALAAERNRRTGTIR